MVRVFSVLVFVPKGVQWFGEFQEFVHLLLRHRFDLEHLDFSAQQRGPTGNSRLATSRTKHSEQTLDDDWSEAVQMCVMKPGRIL